MGLALCRRTKRRCSTAPNHQLQFWLTEHTWAFEKILYISFAINFSPGLTFSKFRHKRQALSVSGNQILLKMTASRLILLIILTVVTTTGNAQRQGRRISLMEYKQRLVNATMRFTEVRTRLNEKTTEKPSDKTIQFTQDNVFVNSHGILEKGIWLDGISFMVTNSDGKQIKYEWLFGDGNSFCFRVDNNKKTVECYKKLK